MAGSEEDDLKARSRSCKLTDLTAISECTKKDRRPVFSEMSSVCINLVIAEPAVIHTLSLDTTCIMKTETTPPGRAPGLLFALSKSNPLKTLQTKVSKINTFERTRP